RRHKSFSAQLDQSPGGGSDQIDMMYTMPWHTAALSNGIIAVLGVLLGGVVLATWLQARHTQRAKAVALGGMILGVLGVLLSAGMCFDLCATPPEMPEQQMPVCPDINPHHRSRPALREPRRRPREHPSSAAPTCPPTCAPD